MSAKCQKADMRGITTPEIARQLSDRAVTGPRARSAYLGRMLAF